MIVVSAAEAMNPSRRNTMEDRHSIHYPGTWHAPDPTIMYLGVYDGHGGRDMVDFLEHGMPYHVAKELENNDKNHPPVSMETRIERAFLMADVHARQAGITASGATVAICLVKPIPESKIIQLTVANAGDSRVVLGQHGEPHAERLSVDHRVDDISEQDRIAKAGGFCWKGRVLGVLAVTRSLGDHLLKEYVIAEPEVRQVQVPDEDSSNNAAASSSFVILGCDGLWDVMTDQEAVDLVRGYTGDKRTVSDHLVKEALDRGTTDNLTVIVAWLC